VATMHVRVVSPETVVFQGEAAGLVAPAWDGYVGVLPGHAPMMALLGVGVLDVDLPGGGSQRFHVAGGVLKVVENQVTVLTEYAGKEPPEVVPEGARIHPEDITESSALAGNPLV
jgi:F-type H+-transporting ATPase subunit epsilon